MSVEKEKSELEERLDSNKSELDEARRDIASINFKLDRVRKKALRAKILSECEFPNGKVDWDELGLELD